MIARGSEYFRTSLGLYDHAIAVAKTAEVATTAGLNRFVLTYTSGMSGRYSDNQILAGGTKIYLMPDWQRPRSTGGLSIAEDVHGRLMAQKLKTCMPRNSAGISMLNYVGCAGHDNGRVERDMPYGSDRFLERKTFTITTVRSAVGYRSRNRRGRSECNVSEERRWDSLST
jgi:hypothetical protein